MKNTVVSLGRKTIFIIDTCHAGNVMGARAIAPDVTGVVNGLALRKKVLRSLPHPQESNIHLKTRIGGNGAFPKAAEKGINGRPDYMGKGRITINMLDLYISERVKELTMGKQTPATAKPQTIPDFPLALKK